MAQLERILDSKTFAATPQLRHLLKYIVEHGFQEDSPPLKEYTLGVDVFERGDDFDPRTDTIVRVNARRLRGRLADYYKTEGQRDRVLIEIPKGHYVARARAVPRLRIPASRATPPIRRREDRTPPLTVTGTLRPDSLPAPRTTLIGRKRILDDLCARLSDPATRLITVTGAGGSGKTRVAQAAAWRLRDEFPGGVAFVGLDTVIDGAGFARALARILGVRHADRRPLPEAIAEHVRQKVTSPMLLVLDNLEQIARHVQLIGMLLDACAPLTVLATSRVTLHVYGEHEYPLEPLALPERDPLPGLPELARNAAVQLFLERADAVSPGYRLTEGNAAAIVALCCRLDGLPLAIELVAAYARTLTPEDMLHRFTGHLDLPAHAAHDLPSRQRTLRRTVDWSHALLDAGERILLRRLAVFAGGFTAEAAEAVADPAGDLGLDINAGLASLVDKNLLYVAAIEPEPRFAKLVTIRTYALERLSASKDELQVRRAHAAYMLVLAEEGNAALDIEQRKAWLARCDLEQDNFHVALDGLLDRGEIDWALRMGRALFAYWERREHMPEARRYLHAILGQCGPETDPALRAKAEYQFCTLLAFQGEVETAAEGFQRVIEALRALGDQRGQAAALNALAVLTKHAGDASQACTYFEQVLAIYRELGDQHEVAATMSNLAGALRARGDLARASVLLKKAQTLFTDIGQPVAAAWCINHLGDIASDEGDYPLSDRLYREAEAIFMDRDDPWGSARSMVDLGLLELKRNHLREAAGQFTRALDAFHALGHRRGVVKVLDGCMQLALQRGDPASALRLGGAVTSLRRTLEYMHRPEEQQRLDETLARARVAIDTKLRQRCWDAGVRMSYAQAVELAVAILKAAGTPSVR